MGHIITNVIENYVIVTFIASWHAYDNIKRGCTRESPKLRPFVTGPSPIWLKIAMVAGNDLKLSHAKYFWTFISEKIA